MVGFSHRVGLIAVLVGWCSDIGTDPMGGRFELSNTTFGACASATDPTCNFERTIGYVINIYCEARSAKIVLADRCAVPPPPSFPFPHAPSPHPPQDTQLTIDVSSYPAPSHDDDVLIPSLFCGDKCTTSAPGLEGSQQCSSVPPPCEGLWGEGERRKCGLLDVMLRTCKQI